VNGRDKSDKREGESGPSDLGRPTVAVVTFILALEERDFSEVKDTKSLKAALMGLGSDVVSNDRLIAAEVMWTPEEPWEQITPDEVTLDFPDLIPL